jgi:hypothetical protein
MVRPIAAPSCQQSSGRQSDRPTSRRPSPGLLRRRCGTPRRGRAHRPGHRPARIRASRSAECRSRSARRRRPGHRRLPEPQMAGRRPRRHRRQRRAGWSRPSQMVDQGTPGTRSGRATAPNAGSRSMSWTARPLRSAPPSPARGLLGRVVTIFIISFSFYYLLR